MITGVILGTAALGLIVSLFGDRYECSPEEVQEACEELSNISNNTLQAISDEIGKEVGIVNNAASGLLDISNMNEYAPAVQDSITNLISVLDKQAEMIEEYNNGNLVEKMLGTGTMAILNLTEGIARFGEDIVDAGANIIAGFGSVFGADMEAWELWAAKDHVGNWFDDAFENGAFNWVEKYSIYSHESTAAEIFKGIGTAIPYIALAATGVGLVAEATVAGAAGFGRGSTNYQQQHLEYDANGVASFDDTYTTGRMMWEGTKQGAIDAATVVVMDKGIKAIGKGISKLKAGKAVAENADDVARTAKKVDDAASTAVKNVDDATRTVSTSADDIIAKQEKALEDLNKAKKNLEQGRANFKAGATSKKELDALEKAVTDAEKNYSAVATKANEAAKTVSTGADDIIAKQEKALEDLNKAKKNLEQGRANFKAGATSKKELDALETAATDAEKNYRALATKANEAANAVPRKADVVADVGEQAASKAAQSGSKWHSPLEATTPRAKVARAYDTAVENMKNAASDVKSKIKGAFDGMKPSGSTASAGPRIGDNSIPARVTQAYDNAVEGIKNVGAKAGTTAKKVVTDTATFVKENPKRAIIGGGLLSTEKAIGNIKTSYIPNNYASAEVQELSKIGGGENRIVIDEVDDLIAQADANTPTTPEPTQPSQTYTGGTSTGGGTYTAPTTPSSNTSPGTNGTGTSTTPSEKPSDSNTTTPGVNDNTNNNNDNKSDDTNKTPDNTTPTTPEPTPSDNGSTVISNPPSNNDQGSSGVNHGGTTNNNTGNSSTGNNNWSSNTTTEPGIEENPELEPELPIEDADLIDEPGEEESVYTIPSNLSGVKQTKKSSSGSGVLPVLGGLGAAAAVGVGAKMYLDNKKNNENGDDDEEYSEGDDENFNTSENDDLLADEWNGEDTEFNYEDSSGDNNVETDDDDLGEM